MAVWRCPGRCEPKTGYTEGIRPDRQNLTAEDRPQHTNSARRETFPPKSLLLISSTSGKEKAPILALSPRVIGFLDGRALCRGRPGMARALHILIPSSSRRSTAALSRWALCSSAWAI